MTASQRLGERGEEAAADYLQKLGYTVLARNQHSRWGEIDIIARFGDMIVFAEVKTRKAGSLVGGAEAVTLYKQQRLRKTAEEYLILHPMACQPRFDVLCVVFTKKGVPLIEHIENAF